MPEETEGLFAVLFRELDADLQELVKQNPLANDIQVASEIQLLRNTRTTLTLDLSNENVSHSGTGEASPTVV